MHRPSKIGPAVRLTILAAVVAAGGVALPGAALARPGGIAAMGCDGCHSGGNPPQVTLTASPVSSAIGEAVTLTVTVTQTNGPIAGFFLTKDDVNNGVFRAIEPGTSANSIGVTHTMPRTGSAGMTTFKTEWSSPVATGVQFSVYALSANGDGTNRGDGGGSAELSIVSGCAGATYYLDQDDDGFGTLDPAFPIRKDCTQPPSYATQSGDCNDFNSTIFPGAPEQCDGKDNNCDGKIDEAVVNRTYCEDKDGDGHGIAGGATKVDCVPSTGFGDCNGDCNDGSSAVYPGAAEVCDGRDNNCNGSVDEGVRMTCGVGWCRRYALGCSALCTPGDPAPETCNYFDDDCDGVIDNGTDAQLCSGAGLTCVRGKCLPGGSAGGGSGGGQSATGGRGVGSAGADGSGASVRMDNGGCSTTPAPPASDFGVALGALVLLVAMRRGSRPRRGRTSVMPSVSNRPPICWLLR